MANVTRNNQGSEMLSLREAMDRLFADSFISPRSTGNWLGRGTVGVNLYETADGFEVQLPLPGVKLEEVAINVQENVVSIKWETKAQTPEGAQPLWTGMQYGEFQQSFTLPAAVNTDAAQAHFHNGILFLQLPKAEYAKPKTIKISAGQPKQIGTIEGQSSRTPSGSQQ